jgi:hypothetical protein
MRIAWREEVFAISRLTGFAAKKLFVRAKQRGPRAVFWLFWGNFHVHF